MSAKRIKTGGRQVGTPNKITSTVREMILNALDAVGGQKWLVQQAEENPTAFMTLLGKILPTQVQGKVDCSVVKITRVIVNPNNGDNDERQH